jgi:hypothetical protein
MNKLLAIVLGISIVGVAAAQAMPFSLARSGFIIQVASGCGLGVNRGPYGGCDPIYGEHYYSNYRHGYYDGFYDGYYYGPGRSRLVDQGACSGRDIYRVCNIYGVCWAACY